MLGQLQGWLLALACLSVIRKYPAHRWLTALLLSLALTLNISLLHELQLHTQWPRAILLLSGLPFLYGPLLLAHVAEQTGFRTPLALRWRLLHAVLPAGYYALILPVLSQPTADIAAMLQLDISGPRRFSLLPSLKHLSFAMYSLWALQVLRRYENRLREQLANVEPYSLNWLRGLVWSALVLTLLLALNWLTGFAEQQHDLLFALAISLLIIAAGFYGLRRVPAATSIVGDGFREAETPVPDSSITMVTGDTDEAGNEQRPLLDENALAVLQQKLSTLGQNEPLLFLHELNLDRLAQALRVSPHQLSWALNQVCHTRFYDFINGLRVQAVQRRLTDPALTETPILDIALTCGFANKTTFNKAFKQSTGMTPSAYRQQFSQPPVPEA